MFSSKTTSPQQIPRAINQSKSRIPIVSAFRTTAKQKHTTKVLETFVNALKNVQKRNDLKIISYLQKQTNGSYKPGYEIIDYLSPIQSILTSKYYPQELYSIQLGHQQPTFINQYYQSLIQAKKETAQETISFIHNTETVSNRDSFINECYDFFDRTLEEKIKTIVQTYKQDFNTNQRTHKNAMNRQIAEQTRIAEEKRIRNAELKRIQNEKNAAKWIETQKRWAEQAKLQQQEEATQRFITQTRRQKKINQGTKHKKPYRNVHTNSEYNISGSSGYGSTENEGYWTNEGNRAGFRKTGTVKPYLNSRGRRINNVPKIRKTLPREYYNFNASGYDSNQ